MSTYERNVDQIKNLSNKKKGGIAGGAILVALVIIGIIVAVSLTTTDAEENDAKTKAAKEKAAKALANATKANANATKANAVAATANTNAAAAVNAVVNANATKANAVAATANTNAVVNANANAVANANNANANAVVNANNANANAVVNANNANANNANTNKREVWRKGSIGENATIKYIKLFPGKYPKDLSKCVEYGLEKKYNYISAKSMGGQPECTFYNLEENTGNNKANKPFIIPLKNISNGNIINTKTSDYSGELHYDVGNSCNIL
jgi:hypothetical protein